MLLVFWHRQRLVQSIVWPKLSPTTHPKLTHPAARSLCNSWATWWHCYIILDLGQLAHQRMLFSTRGQYMWMMWSFSSISLSLVKHNSWLVKLDHGIQSTILTNPSHESWNTCPCQSKCCFHCHSVEWTCLHEAFNTELQIAIMCALDMLKCWHLTNIFTRQFHLSTARCMMMVKLL